MGKQFKAILVDPETQTIKAIETNGSHEHTRELVGARGLDHFRIADFEGSFDYGWVDDTGLTGGKPVYACKFSISHDPIAGRCLILGADKETGATTDASMPLDFLRDHTDWLGLIVPEVFWEETEHGQRAIVTYARAKA